MDCANTPQIHLTAMDGGNAVFAGAKNCLVGSATPSMALQGLLHHTPVPPQIPSCLKDLKTTQQLKCRCGAQSLRPLPFLSAGTVFVVPPGVMYKQSLGGMDAAMEPTGMYS